MYDGVLCEQKPLPKTPKGPVVAICPVPSLSCEKVDRSSASTWRPLSLGRAFLLGIAVTTAGLLVLLLLLLIRSRRNQGLIFAADVSQLSTTQTFLYLYLPTIISVLYGFAWTWIDLDVKRLEPYRSLSTAEGATAEDSLLLQYPFDFLAKVPFKALRRKHWPVFLSSIALLLISWGITPLQTAIFAQETVTKIRAEPMMVSKDFLTVDEQQKAVTANYTYSVFAIAWLDERLPPYMTREGAFAPFKMSSIGDAQSSETWSAATTKYSVDVSCETATLEMKRVSPADASPIDRLYYIGSQGCEIPYPYGPDGNDTMGGTGEAEVKEYSALYAGYQNHDGLADFYISPYCPANASDTFLAAFAQNKLQANDYANTATKLFCQPKYYLQNVIATIRREDRAVLNTTTAGPKQAIPADMFNPSQLEWQINSATQQQSVRGDVPASTWPDQTERLSRLPISLDYNGAKLPMMAGLAIGADQRALDEYLDPETLRQSYEAAYRLLFSRYMVDVLNHNFTGAQTTNGTRTYQIQTIYMVPGFVYAVVGLLGAVLFITAALMVILSHAEFNLDSDPGSMAALMKLTAKDRALLGLFSSDDQDQSRDFRHRSVGMRFHLLRQEFVSELRILSGAAVENTKPELGTNLKPAESPAELSMWTGLSFLLVQCTILVVLACIFSAGLQDGLALPSESRFVRQLLENYLPTVIATLIEPVWVMLNRLLCVLQPFEELHKGNARASRSIDLDYTSLPPQLVLFSAFRRKHFTLGAVCSMALLGNALSVAFGAMFNERAMRVSQCGNFTQTFQAKVKDVDGTLGPWNTSAGIGQGLDQFYIAMSNLTSSTPLPVWTDEQNFHLPFNVPAEKNGTVLYHAQTTSFGANLTCVALRQNSSNTWTLAIGPDVWSDDAVANLSISISDSRLGSVDCLAKDMTISSQLDSGTCPSGLLATEIMTAMQAPSSASARDKDLCKQLIVGGWMRSPRPGHCYFDGRELDLTDNDATLIACLPKVVSSVAEITVDRDGVLQSPSVVINSTDDVYDLFDGQPAQLILQANNFLIGRRTTSGFGGGGTWHNDLFPSDWNNYFMQDDQGHRPFLDPAKSPPMPSDMVPLMAEMYSKLFAIWFSMNHYTFLTPSNATATITATGSTLVLETRITTSKSMFILAEVILGVYMLGTVLYYCKRPGRYLNRLPTTMASVIAMFAASRAVEDMGNSDETWNDPTRRYAFGRYVGTDGKAHDGIERAEYVQVVVRRR